MPSTRLTINFSNKADIQNTIALLSIATSTLTQKDDTAVTPLQVARYFLHSRNLGRNTNFGENIQDHLKYPGGFLTTGNKVNSKFSDFTVEQNLTVSLSSNFNRGFDMFNKNGINSNRITNLRRIDTSFVFSGGSRDNELLTVGDFKKYGYVKGMIMMWSGTYEDLTKHLPLWRLCADPDQGVDNINGITIPNLQNRFIMGGSYTPYQSMDNFSPQRSFSSPTVIGDQGGTPAVFLTQAQLPQHNHDFQFSVSGGDSTISAVEVSNNIEGVAASTTFMSSGRLLSFAGSALIGSSFNYTVSVVNGLTQTGFASTTFSISYTPITFNRTSAGLEDRGGTDSHENRPPYYALAYIIYVGAPRPE